jgi:His Kinase A (phospho-acceptor) domain
MTAMKLRLTGFALAIVLVVLMIAWAAHASWLRVTKLGEKLTSVQITSFRTADYFRANLLELNYTLLRYEIHHDPADRERFLKGLNKLNGWIDVQSPVLTTAKEAHILDQINASYDDYYAASTNHLQKIDSNSASSDSSFAEFEKVANETGRLLGLAYQLVEAHRESLARFVADSQRSLGFLRVLIFASLFLLLVIGAWLAGVVYREMIYPLRLKLVESNAIIERQEKLASLGVLAAGVAHEIRNPLTAIKARLFTQQKVLRPGSPESEDAVVIGNEINRLERIVKEVLQFARPAEPKLALLLASTMLREVRELMAPQLAGASIKLKLELNGGAG